MQLDRCHCRRKHSGQPSRRRRTSHDLLDRRALRPHRHARHHHHDVVDGGRQPLPFRQVRPGRGADPASHRPPPGACSVSSSCSSGSAPEETIKALVASTPHHGWRQLAVIDAEGPLGALLGRQHPLDPRGRVGQGLRRRRQRHPFHRGARRHGASVRGEAGKSPGRSAVRGAESWTRRRRRVQAGDLRRPAGVRGAPFPYVDLRADDHPDPIAEITRLWKHYAPTADNYVKRAFEPTARKPTPSPWAT